MTYPSRRLGWLLMALLALHALVPDVGRAQITPGSGVRLQQGGSDLGRATTLDCESGMTCSITGSVGTLTSSGGGGGAPTTAKYITQTPDAGLSAEQALSALTTGLLFNTTATGVLSIYSGDACTNQFPRSVSASGVWVCAAVAIADLAATGTPSATTFLRGDNTWATPAGGGNVTAGTLTSGTVPKASGATAIADSLLTDNGTTLGYTGTGGVSTPQMTLTGAAPGLIDTLEGAAPSVSASGHARIYADSTTHTFLCSNNGGAYAACGSGGGGSGTVTTSGSPASGNLTKFSGATAITNGDLAGDVTTSGTLTTVLANIPTATPAAGTILHTAIAAPSTPASGKGSVYVDSTSKNLAVKDDAGTVKHGVQTQATVTSSFVTAISDAGAVTVAQPADVDLTFTDVTTNNVSTTKHGFTPKLPNDSSKYLDGTGAYSVPAGGGGGSAGNNNALFTSTADGANNALASDTSIIGTGVGSKTTAANYFVAGTSLMMVVRGTISTAATPATLAIKVKAGSVVVCQMTAQTLTALLSSATWELNVLITNRTAGASGTFKCNGIFASTGAALTPLEASIADTGNAVDTTGTIGWDLTAIWGATTAGDTITGTNFVMFTPGTGLADPGGNGILVRTALNTTSAGNLSGDVTSSNLVTTLANIPTATPAVGTILHTNIAAPSSPAAGKVSVYTDSTDLRLHDKNASGVIGTTVVADTGASNNFLTAISAAGAVSKAQPAFSNLSGSVAASQMPALTGDVTTSAGAVATTIASAAVTYAKMQNVSAASKLLGRGDSGSGSPQEITLGSGLTMTGTTLASAGGTTQDVQSFNVAGGTWTKPANAKSVYVWGCGSGGGGGGGQGAAAGSARTAGGGGGGGYCRGYMFSASTLGSSVTVTVGAGGTAGTGGSSAAGGDGATGASTTFGTLLTWLGGGGGAGNNAGSAGGGGGGCTSVGVSATGATAVAGGGCFVAGAVGAQADGLGAGGVAPTSSGAAGFGSAYGGGGGAASATAGAATTGAGGSSTVSAGGGGAGGGVNAANPGTAQAGTDGGLGGGIAAGGGGTGGTVAACGSGGNGVAGAASTGAFGGSGGGGGASINNATGCVGAAGGAGGGGGGGGGGGTTTGGAGGAGGDGIVIVITAISS